MSDQLKKAFDEVKEAFKNVKELEEKYYYWKDRRSEYGSLHDLKEDYRMSQEHFEQKFEELLYLIPDND